VDESYKSTRTLPRRREEQLAASDDTRACQRMKYKEEGMAEAVRTIPEKQVRTSDSSIYSSKPHNIL